MTGAATEIMGAEVVTVTDTMNLREVAKILVGERITGAPVVDEMGNLVGVISQSDLGMMGHRMKGMMCPMVALMMNPAGMGMMGGQRACYDCHSNETAWLWYSRIAPISRILAWDGREGRAELNFSTWNQDSPPRQEEKMREGWKEIAEGDRPT